MKRIKILGMSLFASILVPFCAASSVIGAQNYDVKTPIKETETHIGNTYRSIRNANEPASDLAELNGEDVKVSINKSQTTSNSQSYQVEFSTEVLTYTDKENQCFIKVDEDNKTLTELPEMMFYKDAEQYGSDPISGSELEEFKAEHKEDWAKLLREPTDEELPSYSGTVYKIKNFSKRKKDVVIPSALRYTNKFLVKVVEIGYDVIDHKKDEIVTSITIPASVDTINHGAFTFPEKVLYPGTDKEQTVKNTTCVINIEGPKKTGFYDGFAEYPDNVHYEQPYEYNDGETPRVYGAPQPFGKPSARYILGIVDSKYNLPLKVTYDLKKADKTTTTITKELPIVSAQNAYDGVGSGVGGGSYVRYVDLDILPGEEIIDETVYFTNIYAAVSEGETWIPDTTVQYYVHPKIEFSHRAILDEFINYSFSSVSKYMGYSTITLEATFKDTPYKKFKPGIYGANEAKINSGEFYIRYRFTSLSALIYSFDYKGENGEMKHVDTQVETPPNQMILENKCNITFMFHDSEIADDFRIENVTNLDLLGLTITLDLFAKDGGRATTRSEFSSRFARTNVIGADNDVAATVFDVNALIIWTVIGYIIAYVAASIAYFLYAKNKFKNDEFRRVKPKRFIKNAVYGLLGTLLTILTIMFITIRSTVLANNLIVFNPTDAFIICFTIVDLIVVGYAAKTLVQRIKAYNIQKRNAALKIDEDVADDGTN